MNRSQGQSEAKPVGFIFGRQLSSEWDEIWHGAEAIQVEHPETTFQQGVSAQG